MDLTYGIDLHVFSWKQAQKYVPEDLLDELELAEQGVLENGFDQDYGEHEHAYIIGFCNGVVIIGSLAYKYCTVIRLEADLTTRIVSGVDTISSSQSCVFFFHLMTRTYVFAKGYKIPKFEQLSVAESFKYTKQFSVYTKTNSTLLHLNILVFSADKLSSNVPLSINVKKDICSICLEQCHTSTVCGHYVCQSCINLVDRKICPQCRQSISGIVAERSQDWGSSTRVGSILNIAPSLDLWKTSFNTSPSFQEFGQVIKSKLPEYSIPYQSGVLSSSPDGWCVIHSLLQMSKWDSASQVEEFVWNLKALGSDGQISVQVLSDLMCQWRQDFNFKIQLTRFDDKIISFPSLVYIENGDGTGHVGWFTPKKFQNADRFYLPLATIRRVSPVIKAPIAIQKLNPVAPIAPIPKKRPAVPLPVSQKLDVQPGQHLNMEKKELPVKLKRNRKCGNSKHTNSIKNSINPGVCTSTSQSRAIHKLDSILKNLDDQISLTHFVSISCSMGKVIQTYLRQVLRKQLYFTLPDLNQFDKQVMSSVHYIQLGYLEPECVLTKTILSKKHFQILASLQKSRHPWLFLEGEPIIKHQMVVKQIISLPQITLGSISNLSIKPLPVSSSALRSLQAPLIASIHQSGVRRIPVKSRTYKSKLSFDDKCNVIANPNGVIHSTFAEVLSIYGQPVTQDQISQSYEGCGGHSHLRFGQDLNQAQILTRLLNDLHIQKNNIVIDVGSKFLSMGGLILKFVQKSIARIMGENFSQALECMSTYDLLNKCNMNAQQADLLIQHPRIIFCPVRPRDTEYNKVYYAESLNKYLNLMHDSPQWMYGFVKLMPPYEMTIQEFDEIILPSIRQSFDDSPDMQQIVDEAQLGVYRGLYAEYGKRLFPSSMDPCSCLSLKQIRNFFISLQKQYPEHKASLQDFYSGDITPLIDALKLASLSVDGAPLVPGYLSRMRSSIVRLGSNIRLSQARMTQLRDGVNRFRECIQLQFRRTQSFSFQRAQEVREQLILDVDPQFDNADQPIIIDFPIVDCVVQQQDFDQQSDINTTSQALIDAPELLVGPTTVKSTDTSSENSESHPLQPAPSNDFTNQYVSPLPKIKPSVDLLDVASLNGLLSPSLFLDELTDLLKDENDFLTIFDQLSSKPDSYEIVQDDFHVYTQDGIAQLSIVVCPDLLISQDMDDLMFPSSHATSQQLLQSDDQQNRSAEISQDILECQQPQEKQQQDNLLEQLSQQQQLCADQQQSEQQILDANQGFDSKQQQQIQQQQQKQHQQTQQLINQQTQNLKMQPEIKCQASSNGQQSKTLDGDVLSFNPLLEDQPDVLFYGTEKWFPCSFTSKDGLRKISAGCCFFKSISFAIFGNEVCFMIIKNIIRESIRFSFVNDESFRIIILACHQSLERYIELFDKVNFNGGEIEASCFSKYTGFDIRILHNHTRQVIRSYQPDIYKYSFDIIFSGAHYDSISQGNHSMDWLFSQICINQAFNYPRYSVYNTEDIVNHNEIGFDVYEDKYFFCTPFKQGRVIDGRLVEFSTLDKDVYNVDGDLVDSPFTSLKNAYQNDFVPGTCYQFTMKIDEEMVKQVLLYGPKNSRLFVLGQMFSGVICSSDSSFIVYAQSKTHEENKDPVIQNDIMAQRFRFRGVFNYQYTLSTLNSLNIPSKPYEGDTFERSYSISPVKLSNLILAKDLPMTLGLPADFRQEGVKGVNSSATGWMCLSKLFCQAAMDANCLTYLKSILEPHLSAPLTLYNPMERLFRHAYYDSGAKDSTSLLWSPVVSWMLSNHFFTFSTDHQNYLIDKLPKLLARIAKEEDQAGLHGGVTIELDRLRHQSILIQNRFAPKQNLNREYDGHARRKKVRLGCLFNKKILDSFQQTNDRSDLKISRCHVMYYLSDVHYYLPEWKPLERSMLYVAGGVFHPFPGQYDLPMGEGSFSVMHNGTCGRVVMITQGQGIPYDHPLVNIRNPTYRMDYGWYSHVGLIVDFIPGDKSPFEPVYIPPFFAPRSVQGTFLCNFYESKTVVGLKTISDELRYWSNKCFTPQDIRDFGSCYQIKQRSIFQRLSSAFGKTPHLLGKISNERQLLQRFQELQGADSWQQSSVVQSEWSLGFLFKKVYSTSNSFHQQDFARKWRWFENGSLLSKVAEQPSIFSNLQSNSQHDILLGNLKSDRLVCQAYNIELQNMNPLQSKMGKMLQENIASSKKHKGQHEFVSKDYFQAIPLSAHHINMPDIKLLPSQPEWIKLWTENVDKIRQWVTDHPQPVINHKNKLLPFSSQGQVIPSGYAVADVSDGVQQEFEWSSKVVQNGVFALFQRQFASSLTLIDEDLRDFDKMTDEVFEYFNNFLLNNDWVELQNSDPFVWLDSKDFDQGKKDKYQKTMQRQLTGDTNFIGSFKTMVKSGEINYTTQIVKDEFGRLVNQDTRPRNICVPSATSCGLLTWIQSTIFPVVKKCFPGFIQGLNKDQLLSRFRTGLSEQHQSLSLDGSSFDSTQYEQIMKLVDTKLWNTLAPHIETWLLRNQSPSFRSLNISEFVSNLCRSATNYSNILFTNIPGVCSSEWPMDAQNQWNRDWAPEYGRYSPEILLNWCVFKVQGTTFSGHPTLTTLGNTFRELCYLWWYCRQAGFDRLWDQEIARFLRIFVCAAGDDGLIQSLHSEQIKRSIFQYSSTTKTGESSLGQCIKDVKLSRWDDIDFCSKWSFSQGDVNSLTLFRDLYKTLTTKQYYTKGLSLACIYPQIHAQALLEGLRSEHTSHLLEDLLRYRVFKYEKLKPLPEGLDVDLSKFNSQLIHTFNDDSNGYDFERQINDKLKINLFTLLKILSTDQLVLGKVRRDHEWYIKYIQSRIEKVPVNSILKQRSSQRYLQSIKNNNSNRQNSTKLTMSDKIQNNNNNNNNSNKDKQHVNKDNARRRRRPRDGVQKVAGFAGEVSTLKHKLAIDLNPKQVQESYQDKDNASHSQVVQLVSHIENSNLRNQGLMSAIGLKFASKASIDVYNRSFQRLSVSEQRHLLSVVLADDWGTVVKGLSKVALPLIWGKLKNTTFGQKALKMLHDYTGIDMNDDKGGFLGNQFTSDPSLRRQIQWDEMSPEYANSCRSYDGVSTQAIASILFPEYTSSRVPSDVAIKCGKVSRQQTITITTNASGNAIFAIYPLCPQWSDYIQVWNDSTLNVQTGVQTPSASSISGPLYNLTSVVSLRTTATSCIIEPIVSSLNNQGRIITVMSNSNSSQFTTTAPTGSTGARDREYVTYSSVAGSAGHRMSYYDSSVADEGFLAYGNSPDRDFMQIIVEGAAPSVAVFQITYTYQVEYTINSNVLIELAMPPTGPATMKCLATSISQNPQLRLIGRQESKELYMMILQVQPRYDSVMRLLVNHVLSHPYESVHTGGNSTQSGLGYDNASMSDYNFQPVLASE